MLSIGHRGARGHAPENTLASIRRAIALGADWVEFDVYYIDGELILFHDERLERTTNGQGFLSDHRFEVLRRLDAGDGEQIPTLAEVFELAVPHVGLNIELKGPGTARPVVAFLQDWQRQDPSADMGRILLSSFRLEELREVQRLEQELGLGLQLGALFVELPGGSMEQAIEQALDLGAWSLNPAKELVTAELVAAAHAAGLKLLVFTVNEPEEIERLRGLGVDGLFSDYPERVIPKPSSR